MITGIVELRDFLPDPDAIVRAAKSYAFYSLDQHPDPQERKLKWKGMRSDSLYKFDLDLSDKLFHSLFTGIAKHTMGSDKYRLLYEYVGNSLFHYMTEDDAYDESWLHDDQGSVLAGVLYLNKETPKGSGTVVFVDGKPIEIESEYNKLVLYPANLKHAARSGFGKDVNDARLTLAFFVSSVGFRLSCD